MRKRGGRYVLGKRGASSGIVPTGRGLAGLLQQHQANVQAQGVNYQNTGDYTDNNNPNLLKYQQQTDDKTANFLAGTDRNVDLNDPQYADGYTYHDLPLNKLLLRLGITGGPQVLSESDFNSYVQQTGATVVYRGWSGSAAVDRFMNATHNHVGNGIAGDGYYFSPNLSTAQRYAGYGSGNITKMALSPSARVISWTDLQNKMAGASSKLQGALRKAGTRGSGRTYGSNSGEAQMALKLGYNAIDMGGGYYVGITADAFVVSRKVI